MCWWLALYYCTVCLPPPPSLACSTTHVKFTCKVDSIQFKLLCLHFRNTVPLRMKIAFTAYYEGQQMKCSIEVAPCINGISQNYTECVFWLYSQPINTFERTLNSIFTLVQLCESDQQVHMKDTMAITQLPGDSDQKEKEDLKLVHVSITGISQNYTECVFWIFEHTLNFTFTLVQLYMKVTSKITIVHMKTPWP